MPAVPGTSTSWDTERTFVLNLDLSITDSDAELQVLVYVDQRAIGSDVMGKPRIYVGFALNPPTGGDLADVTLGS